MKPFGLGWLATIAIILFGQPVESFAPLQYSSSSSSSLRGPRFGRRPSSSSLGGPRSTTLLRGADYDGLPIEAVLSMGSSVAEKVSSWTKNIPSMPVFPSLPSIPAGGVGPNVASIVSALQDYLANSNAHVGDSTLLEPVVRALEPLATVLSHVDPQAQPLLLAPLLALAAAKISEAWDSIDASSSGSGTTSSPSSPYSGGQGSYNEEAAKAFYGERPLLVVKRLLSLAQLTGAFNLKLLFDYLRTPKGAEAWINEAERAKEALVLATKLGPTFIKLGQAASIRTDLIPQPYALELRQLQDAVPPFESQKAMEIVRRELGVESLSEVFSSLSSEPVASASIGQVYKGTLKRRGGGRRRRRTATTKISSTGESEQLGEEEEEEGEEGREVAVKVQRPSVLSEIALDLFLLRLLAPLQVRISNALNKVPTDEGDIATAIALVDEWGRGFVAEVDYKLEAKNTKEFKAAMERRNLQAVTAPTVVDELSSSVVLVTEWVEGTRLDRDASSDVPRLCGVAINAYLTMLLDTGTLHCDPHPGNLLRTTDGKLCVLDWGMTLEVPRDLQYGLLEFIAHVNSEDYEGIPKDFVNLGFTPPHQLERVQSSGITEGLTFALRQLSQGGGANKVRARLKQEFSSRYGEGLSDDELRVKAREEMLARMEEQLASEGVDVNQVTNVMEEMSRRNKELFKLPPYVLYVSRAFSTLEGIGLSIDEDYAILQECYPYLAKRLLTDNSPRARTALLSMLYDSKTNNISPAAAFSSSDQPVTITTATAAAATASSSTADSGPILASGDGGAVFAAQGVADAQVEVEVESYANDNSKNLRQHHQRKRRRSSQRLGSGGGEGGMLSAEKVGEMASGFTSYTAATSSAVNEQGMLEARNGLVDLVLAEFEATTSLSSSSGGGIEEERVWGERQSQEEQQQLPSSTAERRRSSSGHDGGTSMQQQQHQQQLSRRPNVVQEVLVEEAARVLDAAIAKAVASAAKSAFRMTTTTPAAATAGIVGGGINDGSSGGSSGNNGRQDLDYKQRQQHQQYQSSSFPSSSSSSSSFSLRTRFLEGALESVPTLLKRQQHLAESAVSALVRSPLVPPPLKVATTAAFVEGPKAVSEAVTEAVTEAITEAVVSSNQQQRASSSFGGWPSSPSLPLPNTVKESSVLLLDTLTPEDEEVLKAANKLLQVATTQFQSSTTQLPRNDDDAGSDGSGGGGGGSDQGINWFLGRGAASTSSVSSLLSSSPDAAIKSVRSAVNLLLRSSGEEGDGGEEKSSDEELLLKLANKGPGAAARLSRLLAASLVARAADRLDAATDAQLEKGLIEPNGSIVGARDAATKRVLEPLLSALEANAPR